MEIAKNVTTATDEAGAAAAVSALDPSTVDATTNDSSTVQTTDSSQDTSDGFAEFMYKALGRTEADQVNEEELFAAAIGRRLGSVSQEAADYYESEKSRLMSSRTRADGYVPVEDIANAALKATADAGKVSIEDAERIKGECFLAAQLDDKTDVLYDGRGSGADPTIAVAQMSAALLDIQTKLDQIDSGEITAESRSLDAPSNGSSGSGVSASGAQSMDGSGGFLWKPVSESDGNLVVLLPTDLKGLIDRVEIHTEVPPTEETKVAEGRFAGDTHNGGRAHFRFDKPGADYGDNIHLVCYKDDGSYVSWAIGNGGDRHD
jgi:hypothetical protein